MDRGRSTGTSRCQKKAPIGGELYALGAKVTREDKLKLPQAKTIGNEAKRDCSASTLANTKKRMKIVPGETMHLTPTCYGEQRDDSTKDDSPMQRISSLCSAFEKESGDYIEQICASFKLLRASQLPSRTDTLNVISLAYILKVQPGLFMNERIFNQLVNVLRRESARKHRLNSVLYGVHGNFILKVYSERRDWPDLLLRTYIDDAVNERIWSDNPYCSLLIRNITAAFKTIIPNNNLLRPEATAANLCQIPRDSDGDNESSATIRDDNFSDASCDKLEFLHSVRPRYGRHFVESIVSEAVKEQLNKRQQIEAQTKHFLKFLCTAAGIREVRSMSIGRLELWMNSAKLLKPAQELMAYICINVKENNFVDKDVITSLIKIRLKPKPVISHYLLCIKEIINHRAILKIVLKQVVQNELSNSRNPNNMGMLAVMFQVAPVQSAEYLAEIYQEFLTQRDDCLRTLRSFLRELVRMLRWDIKIVKFCTVLLNGEGEHQTTEFQDRVFNSIVDIVCLSMLLLISPQIRDAYVSQRTTGELGGRNLSEFYNNISQIQYAGILWMSASVPRLFPVSNTEYNQALQKFLLLETPDQYSRLDQWPNDTERVLLEILSHTPVHEDTLLNVILMALRPEIPIDIDDTFDTIINVIQRASRMKISNNAAVKVTKFEIIDLIFNMVEYHCPDDLKLVDNLGLPKLALISLYWKAWIILLLISAHNMSSFGTFCWTHFPTMKTLIEICITSHTDYSEEYQMSSAERGHIMEIERYLLSQIAPETIVKDSHFVLTSHLIIIDPSGPCRKMPPAILDKITAFNLIFKLGHLFCRCRNPDLLLDIIQRHGTSQSMPWLSELVQNSDGNFSHLPVQCLCEFLLSHIHNINEDNQRDIALVRFLRNLVTDPTGSIQCVCEVLDYIFRRLSSTTISSRHAALFGIQVIFKHLAISNFPNEWLLDCLPQIPHFNDVRPFIIPQLRSACQVENSPELIMSYIQFIATHTLNDPVEEMIHHVIDMAQLIVERSTMFQFITSENNLGDNAFTQTLKCLFVMFNNYIIRLQEMQDLTVLDDYPDLLTVHFAHGAQLPLHINIIHAFIILLSFSNNSMPESIPILDYWFPPGGRAPLAHLANMPENPVQIFPDWLKLKMIRSSVDRLIDAALQDLTPDQIVLFVQNFGTPINSMSKLLALLDTAVIHQVDEVRHAILNKAYLSQLIEIQQSRGAKNGHCTVQDLELESHSRAVPDLPNFQYRVLQTVALPHVDSIQSASVQFGGCFSLDILDSVRCNDKFNLRKDLIISIIKEVSGILGKMEDLCIYQPNICRLQDTFAVLRTLLTYSLKADDDQIKDLCNFFSFPFKTELSSISDFKGCLIRKSICKLLQNLRDVRKSLESRKHQNKVQKKKVIREFLHKFRYTEVSSTDNDRSSFLNSVSQAGLFVDCLVEVTPEIIGVVKKLQNKYLFSIRCSEVRFYLLSLTNHHTNWHTIVSFANELFSYCSNEYDYSTVLNFFEALINNPKLWRGCDKHKQKSSGPHNFSLEKSELESFVQTLLNEVVAEMKANANSYDLRICDRIHLYFRVSDKNGPSLAKFADYVVNYSSSKITCELKCEVLQQFYVMFPVIKFLKPEYPYGELKRVQTLKGCRADKPLHILITCMGSLISKRDFETLAHDTELLIRKLAATHPTLFLRQMSIISSLIEGKAPNSLQRLRDEYHLHRFGQILRALELLRPAVFDDNYKINFQKIISNFFSLFRVHRMARETLHLVSKFLHLLQSYINVNPSSGLSFIERYTDVLIEWESKNLNIDMLSQLVEAIGLFQHNSLRIGNNKTILTEEEPKFFIDFPNCSIVDNDSKKQTLPNKKFTAIASSVDSRTIFQPRFEINETASPLSDVIQMCLQDIFSPFGHIRHNAFIMLIRHLEYNPGIGHINMTVFKSFMQCLQDENMSVASSAVDCLPEITLLLQEFAVEILESAFSLAINKRINICTQIRKVFEILLMQLGI